MSIAVTCPGCSATLNAPDSAAGKKVKCPKPGCETLMIIPEDLEAAEVEARPRRRPADDDDDRPRNRRRRDEDDDDDDRPRKRKQKKQSGMGAGAITAIFLGGILLLGGVAAGIYFLVGKNDDAAGGGGGGSKSAVPSGWVEYKSDSDKFRGYFPGQVRSSPLRNPNPDLPPPRSITQYACGTSADAQMVVVYVAQLEPGSPAAVREAWAADFNKSRRAAQNSVERAVTWAGHNATEFTITKSAAGNQPASVIVVRQMAVGDTLYGAIFAHKGSQPTADVSGFFDNFEILK